MGNYTAKSTNDKNSGASQLKDKITDKAGAAALEGMGVPKPLADLAIKQAKNGNLKMPGMKNPFQNLNRSGNGSGNNRSPKPNEATQQKEADKAKDSIGKGGIKEQLKDGIKEQAKEKAKEKIVGDSPDKDVDAEVKINIKNPVVLAGISLILFIIILPFFLIFSVVTGVETTYGSYNGEDNLYKLNPDSSNNSMSPLFTSLDGFLFIGDSRYEGASSQLSALGDNITVAAVSCSTAKQWLNVTKTGSGTVNASCGNSKNITLPESAPGISIMLGVNDLSQESDLKTDIQNLHSKYPSAIIFINSIYHVGSGYRSAASFNKKIDAFNNKMREYSESNSWLYYIDVTSGLHDGNGYLKKEYTTDNLHMTSAGNKILATNIKNAILSINGGINDANFIFYYQDDPKWANKPFCGKKTIRSAGCGGTSYAIVVANMTSNRNFTPWDASKEGKGSGHCGFSNTHAGATAGLFTDTLVKKHPELKSRHLSVNKSGATDALNVLKSGGMIIANVQSRSPFTSGGHWIVLRGLDANGKVKIANPNHKAEDQTFDIYDFINKKYLINSGGGTHPWIAIYK